MKSKNIPADIRSKTTKEAQNEIKEIISSLESDENKLQDSIEKYNRMLHLNNHIQEKFREKSKEISKSSKFKKQL
jgi:exonuclease VII small subunit